MDVDPKHFQVVLSCTFHGLCHGPCPVGEISTNKERKDEGSGYGRLWSRSDDQRSSTVPLPRLHSRESLLCSFERLTPNLKKGDETVG